MGSALKRAIAKAGIRSKDAVLAIPASLTESQTVSLPDNLTEDELFVQVESEANRLFPPSQNVNFDYVVIGPSETEGGIGVRVMATVAERVTERVTAAEMAGLRPIVMDVEENAIQRAMTHMRAVKTSATEAEMRDMPVVAMFHLGGRIRRPCSIRAGRSCTSSRCPARATSSHRASPACSRSTC